MCLGFGTAPAMSLSSFHITDVSWLTCGADNCRWAERATTHAVTLPYECAVFNSW
jgi:hypothetical protein